MLADGIDSNQQRKEQKQASKIDSVNTFKNIALEWYEGRKDRWSVGYRDDMMDAFEKDVFPYIGNRPIAEIKPMELLEVLSIMEKRGATEKLKKVRQRCGEVWRYAIITGRAEYNPAPDLASAFVPHKREHYAHLSVSELPQFLSSIDKYMGSQIVRVALKVLILTGVWEISAEKMKRRRPHIVPLSEQVVDLLKQIHPISGSYQYIFPSCTDYRKHISDMALNTMIRRMGYSGRATGHGFRHTMSTHPKTRCSYFDIKKNQSSNVPKWY